MYFFFLNVRLKCWLFSTTSKIIINKYSYFLHSCIVTLPKYVWFEYSLKTYLWALYIDVATSISLEGGLWNLIVNTILGIL